MALLDDDTLARLGHLNYIEFGRAFTRSSGLGGTIFEEGGMVLLAGDTPFPVVFNSAWRTDPTLAGSDAVARSDAFFSAKAHGYSIMVRDENAEDDDLRAAAEAAGLVAQTQSPEMVCRTRVEARPLPAGATLRWVDDEATFHDFVAVNDAAYTSLGMPAGTIIDAITDLPAMTAPTIHSVVAYLDAAPVAAAQTILSHSIAGVYFVGTVEAARGTGLGDGVTRAVTNRAFDEGAIAVTLQASSMGEPIYRRMGYETLYHYSTYVRFRPPRKS
jgi:GNAT superfamily N-acetyltransferase